MNKNPLRSLIQPHFINTTDEYESSHSVIYFTIPNNLLQQESFLIALPADDDDDAKIYFIVCIGNCAVDLILVYRTIELTTIVRV